MLEKPKFLQGVFAFEGKGLDTPFLLDQVLAYTVPSDRRAQLIYLRAGNTSEELIYLDFKCGRRTMRLFPIGAKASIHVPLAVVEDLHPESLIEVCLAAPAGLKGTVVVDIGLVEI
jgi:hypothetical protein